MYHEEGSYPDNRIYQENSLSNIFDDNLKSFTNIQEDSSCPPFWDTLSCFPATPAGTVQIIPCVPEMYATIDGVKYITKLDTTSKLVLLLNGNKIFVKCLIFWENDKLSAQ